MDNWLAIILVGLAAGWIANAIMKGKRQGLVGNLVIGVLGAFVGAFIFQFLGIPVNNLFANLVSAIAGAVVLIYLLRILRNI
jgi:uncharacterized membrane protein YeaQ/YmgE (transglycosylase-associated protein family)